MKTLRILIFGLLATAVICRAQITDPGWFAAPSGQTDISMPEDDSAVETTNSPPPQIVGLLGLEQNPAPIAEAITPQIQTLATNLQNDPVKIFNYVHDNIRFVLYFGAKKGAQLTLLEKSGNDFDQCALLVALLRAAGYNNATYQFGPQVMPYDSTNHQDLHHWLQLNLVNTNLAYVSNYLANLLGERGYAFNPNGTPASRTDFGGATTFGQDSYGQLNLITYPNGDHEYFTNNSFGDVIGHADARGFGMAYQYNLRRQLTNTIAPTNLTIRAAYDAVGNVSTATDARGNTTSNTWSATRKLLATKFPATSQGASPIVVTNIYDVRDWLTQTIDPLQHATQFTDDFAGNLLAATDPLLRTTQAGYNADGRTIASTNAAGEKTFQQWNRRGQLTMTTDNAGNTVKRGYDAAGNQITLTNRNNNKWQFQYDAANRLTNTISPLGRATSQSWNHQGLLATVTLPSGRATTNSYDGRGRLASRADIVGTTTYQPDANNNMTNVYENGLTNSWTFDAYNRPSSYRDVYGNLIQYKYDAKVTKKLGNMSVGLQSLQIVNGSQYLLTMAVANLSTNKSIWVALSTDQGGNLKATVRDPNGYEFNSDGRGISGLVATFLQSDSFYQATEIKPGDSTSVTVKFNSHESRAASAGLCIAQLEFLLGDSFANGQGHCNIEGFTAKIQAD